MVQHLVLFRFRTDLPPDAVAEIFAELRGLQGRIDGITGFSGGADASREGLTKGFTHGFCMTFRDGAARDAYLPHPEHQRVVAQLLPMLEGRTASPQVACDGWSPNPRPLRWPAAAGGSSQQGGRGGRHGHDRMGVLL